MRGGVTDAGQRTTNERTNIEDRATQPMEAGGWVSQFLHDYIHFSILAFLLQFVQFNLVFYVSLRTPGHILKYSNSRLEKWNVHSYS